MDAVKEDFIAIVREYSEDMVILAHSIVGDPDKANEIVQDLLLRLKSEIDFNKLILPIDKFLFAETKKACKI